MDSEEWNRNWTQVDMFRSFRRLMAFWVLKELNYYEWSYPQLIASYLLSFREMVKSSVTTLHFSLVITCRDWDYSILIYNKETLFSNCSSPEISIFSCHSLIPLSCFTILFHWTYFHLTVLYWFVCCHSPLPPSVAPYVFVLCCVPIAQSLP